MNTLKEYRDRAIAEVLNKGSTSHLSLDVAARLVELVIEGAAEAAENSSRSFGDTEGIVGCKIAAEAVRHFGKQLLK